MSHYFFALVFLLFVSEAFAQEPVQGGAQSRGNSFNPDIGLNLLMLYQNSNRGNDPNVEDPNGFSIQEAELQFSADVDPYWRLVSTFALHSEFDEEEGTREMHFGAEEAYAESLAIPVTTLKVGKFKAAFGKHNLLHAHAFPFIDAPLINTDLLGEEGFNDVGASVAALLPTPWFSEVTLQGLSGKGEGLEYFDGPSANNVVGVLHLKNLWDLTDDLTFELGVSGASGENASASSTNLYGVDTTFKWRPNGSRERAVIWSTEVMSRDFNQASTDERDAGFATWLQYQFSTRWWVQARAEYLQARQQDLAAEDPLPEFQRKQSVLVGFVPSEFSAVRLQYDHLNDGEKDAEQRVMLQLNYSIGAHPAHAY
ncbi:MAG TPA: hypothetical protein VM432_07030 [Bdellovibrionales bacterium]|nr:hypothetical protein [Bdellovibrionales bacterium]